jgi:hypothetical protein
MAIHILGIRHHGVGSAKNVKAQLAKLKPDLILVEGPPEITEVLSIVGDEGLVPPVAIMVYNSEEPKESTFYPFAEYSPEWIAIQYANKNKIPVRAMDLPAAVSFLRRREQKTLPDNNGAETKEGEKVIYKEPLSYLADASGFRNGEAWWDHHFEQEKITDHQHFEAVMHAMDALRAEGLESHLDQENIDREAFMRNIMRQAQNEMYERIAVICGAWHAPALTDLDGTAKADAKILKELPRSKVKIASTWIPWTNARLSMFSGYGAGIYSPGWYEHQWKTPDDTEIKWLTNVAETFRRKDIDISTAHVIEAVHLSRSLSALRKKPFVSLDELNEATLAVMCMGDEILLQLVKDKLIVGNKLGKVPANIPRVPLQEDFEQHIKSLRLRLSAAPKQYDLDLRKDIDLARSIFFHRLEILEIPWLNRTSSRTKGTFKESWLAEWQPEMMVVLIDKAFLGNTVGSAAQAVVLRQCRETSKVSAVAELIQLSIPAELYDSLNELLDKINELSSISADIIDLMNALPRLVEVSRYGNVRKSDLTILNSIVQQLLTKVFIGLPNACYGLDEDNSNMMFTLISQVNNAVRLYEDETIQQQWYDTLHKLVDKAGVHHIILGCVCRLLLDAQQLTEEEADRRISFALSPGNDPHQVAAWLEGFLRGSGMILIYDNRLWNLLYSWVSSLPDNVFNELLALLRRAFSKFEFGERRQIGERSKKGLVTGEKVQMTAAENFNTARALAVLPTVKELLGNP